MALILVLVAATGAGLSGLPALLAGGRPRLAQGCATALLAAASATGSVSAERSHRIHDEVPERGGGHYVSAIGRNALFHSPEDRGATVVDPAVIARFVDAFTNVARALAG